MLYHIYLYTVIHLMNTLKMNTHEVNLDGILRPLNEESSKLLLQNIPIYRFWTFISKLVLSNNNLTSVPDLSYLKTLKVINISRNQISRMPNLPLTIENIDVENNLIPDVDVIRYTKLIELDISFNPTTTISALPKSLLEFRAIYTEFTEFKDELPTNIQLIDLEHSKINQIPTIPVSVVYLDLQYTNIQSVNIEYGDSKLIRLYCYNTPINNIINLENTKLEKFKCHMCPNLSSIPTLPSTIVKFVCGGIPTMYTNLKLPEICDTELKTFCMTYTTNTYLPTLPTSIQRLIVPFNKLSQLGVLKNTSITEVCINYNNLTCIPEVPSTLESWSTDYILRVDGIQFPQNIIEYDDEEHAKGNSLISPFNGTVDDIKNHYIELKDQFKNLNNTKILGKRLNNDILSIIGSNFEQPKRIKTLHDQIEDKKQEITHSKVYYDISNKQLT